MFELPEKSTIANATELLRDFGRVMRRVQQGDVVIIRHNAPVAALISMARWEQLHARPQSRSGPALAPQPLALRHFVEHATDASSALGRHVQRLILFGSVVRGEAHADSDIDLLVLVDDLNQTLREAISGLATDAMAATDYRELLSAIPMTLEHWRQLQQGGALLAREVARDGVVVWER